MASRNETRSEFSATAPFNSILFPSPVESGPREVREPPVYFRDLNLDRIVAAVTADWKEYALECFFHKPLNDIDRIVYRQEVMRDLEHESTMLAVRKMAERMRQMRRCRALAEEVRCKPERERWLLSGAEAYCEAVEGLGDDLDREADAIASRGLRSLRHYISDYVASKSFAALKEQARRVESALASVRYGILLNGDAVTVRRFEDDIDYAPLVEATFERFRGAAEHDYRVDFEDGVGLNHVETQILERVAQLNPEAFGVLADFCAEHAEYIDEKIGKFDREVHFYVACLQYFAPLRRTGLPVCYPQLAKQSKYVAVSEAYDAALATKLLDSGMTVVRNDCFLQGSERILVVSGPNQGGKTTFARTFGQLHYLASLGCPVAAREAHLWLFDAVFTHFEREEKITTLRGKLEDDLVRIRRILDAATPSSILILNELFSSTTLEDAVFLSRKIMAKVSALDAFCVWVTFLDEIASFDGKTVSLVAGLDSRDPAVRTYRLERRPADGLAYAFAIAEKYRLTHGWLTERIATEAEPPPKAGSEDPR